MNPYTGADFFQFFTVLFSRFGAILQGELATDEVQLLVLVGVAISASLVGVFLVLKKMAMLANSLSHTLLVGIVFSFILFGVVGFSLGSMLVAAFFTAIITALLTQFLTHIMKVQEDASIGLVFTTLFALGIVLVTLYTRNAHIGTEAIMGNVDALHVNDLKLIGYVTLIDILVITLFFKEFKLTTFDPLLSKSFGISSNLFSYLLMLLTSLTVIGAFRAVGVILVLAFLVGPPLCARLLTNDLKRLIWLSMLIGSLCSALGVALSRHILSVFDVPLSTAGIVVTLIGLVYLLILLYHKVRCQPKKLPS